ncbi:MAG: M23 family metallopeptidase, partial [Acidobacteriota bacterium]
MSIRKSLVFLIPAVFIALPATAQYDTDAVWPLCGNYYLTAPSTWDPITEGCPSNRWGMPDLINDTYGPRLLDDEYDWHRGIDLHTDDEDGRPVFAMTCGKARTVENTYNGEVIIEHYPGHVCQDTDTLADFPKCHNVGGCYYSRYQHLSSAVVVDETLVKKGELVGYSGRNTSSPTADNWDDKYPHVHFEIRDYPGGPDYYARGQREAIHPLAVLPYNDQGDGGMTLSIVNVDTSSQANTVVDVALSLPNDGEELDLVRVDVSIDINGQPAQWVNPGTGYPTPEGDDFALDPPFLDMEQRSRQYNYTDTTKVPFEEFLDAANHPGGVDGQWLSPYADPASPY